MALVYAARADALGNLWYRHTARNFNPLMATAATITIAEAGEIVPAPASSIRSRSRPRISTSTTWWLARDDESTDPKTRHRRACGPELRPGEVVNLGIGIPNLIPGYLGTDTAIFLHTENGLLGVGPRPGEDELDPDLVDAAKRPITALAGRFLLRQRVQLRHDPRWSCGRRRTRRAPGQRAR